MEVLCGEEVLNLDVCNDYLPDGKNRYCALNVATYNSEVVNDAGNSYNHPFPEFLKTSDNGAVYLSDFAFKIALDIFVKTQSPAVSYLRREMDRGVSNSSGNEMTHLTGTGYDEKGYVNVFDNEICSELDIHDILIRNTSRVVSSNLAILTESDLYSYFGNLCVDKSSTKECKDSVSKLLEFLVEYIYPSKTSKWTFVSFVKQLTQVFYTLSVIELKNFVDNVYFLLDKIPEKLYDDIVLEAETDTDVEEVKTPVEEKSEKQVEPQIVRKLKRISGSDITGKDETYSANYCEAFYTQDLENADADGFLEKVIASRANGTAAPIDLLSEGVENRQASKLRDNLSSVRKDLEAIAGHMNPVPVV